MMGCFCLLPLLLYVLSCLILLLFRKLLVHLWHWKAIDYCAVISLAESCFDSNILLCLWHTGDKGPLRKVSRSRVLNVLSISISHGSYTCWTMLVTVFVLNGGHLSCTFPIQITSEHRGLLRFILTNIRLFRHSFKLVVLIEKLHVDLLNWSILIISWLILIILVLDIVSVCDSSL